MTKYCGELKLGFILLSFGAKCVVKKLLGVPISVYLTSPELSNLLKILDSSQHSSYDISLLNTIPNQSKVHCTCMSHKESMQIPLTTRNLVHISIYME